MTPMQARLLLSKIDNITMDTATRVSNAKTYHEGLSNIKELILPPLKQDGSHIYTVFPVRYANRDLLARWLMRHRRDVGIHHFQNCASLPEFREYYRDCPRATAVSNEVIPLPTYPRYGLEEVKKNIEVIRVFFRK